MPEHVVPVAYLCVGPVTHFEERPDLETKGWNGRLDPARLLMSECYGGIGEDALRQTLTDPTSRVTGRDAI